MNSPLTRLIDSIVRIHSIPATLARVQAVLAENDAPMGRLVEVIEQDPALAADVLRLANSPPMGLRERVSSILLACTFLGTKALEQLAVQATVLSAFADDAPRAPFDPARLWRHSFESAAVARVLHAHAGRLVTISAPEAYTAGLLHDVGKIILLQQQPARFAEALAASESAAVPLAAGEQAVFGFTAADVAARLAQRWRLGAAIETAVSRRWHRATHPSEWAQAALVHAASALAHELGPAPPWRYEPIDDESLRALGITPEVRESTLDLLRRTLGGGD